MGDGPSAGAACVESGGSPRDAAATRTECAIGPTGHTVRRGDTRPLPAPGPHYGLELQKHPPLHIVKIAARNLHHVATSGHAMFTMWTNVKTG